MTFQFHLPVNLIFGCGAAEQIGTETAKYGRRALIVTGRSSTKESGLLERAETLLKEAGVTSVLFDQVRQNPLTTTVMEGAALGRESGCDSVVALGGGSVIDAAKAIALMCTAEGDINDYILQRRPVVPPLPIIAVPTTCGTGSEGNGTAVLSNPNTNDKRGLRHSLCIPKASIIDPLLMKTMPKSVLASVGFDALCHCMESCLSRKSTPMSAMMALQGMELAISGLPAVYADYDNNEAWEQLTLASTLGGMTIFTSSVAAPHGIEHPASGLRDLVHGRGLAALTPVIYERTLSAAPETFETISKLLGGKTAADCPDRVRRFLEQIDLNTTLSQQGVQEEDIDWMADNCMQVSAMMLQNHPVAFSRDDVREIYRAAL